MQMGIDNNFSIDYVSKKIESTKDHIEHSTQRNDLFIHTTKPNNIVTVTWEPECKQFLAEDEFENKRGFENSKNTAKYLLENYKIVRLENKKEIQKKKERKGFEFGVYY